MQFNIITLGCKVNTYESNYMRESLENNGFLFSEEYKNSDIVIVNTCSVTDTSDKKCLKMVRRVKRENPSSIIVVCGCSSQYNPKPYQDMGVNILLGNQNKSKIVKIINNYLDNHQNYCMINDNRDLPFEDMHIDSFEQVRAYVKIQDGCNNFCSYCIIPYVRGDIRSKDFDVIRNEVINLANKGFKEIVLTGIHTGSYQDHDYSLSDVIEMISKIHGIKRIRLSSVEITELNDNFMKLLKNNNILCNHLHIPLQAGSDEILKLMHRKYDLAYYEKKIKEIRDIKPDISITTDVIVGFPGETEELFQKTCDFCEKINFAKIHVFPFSERKGTAASFMDNKIDDGTKKARARKLIALSQKLEINYFEKFKGKKLDILIEEIKDGCSYGHTSNYLNVKLDEVLEVNKIYTKEIK